MPAQRRSAARSAWALRAELLRECVEEMFEQLRASFCLPSPRLGLHRRGETKQLREEVVDAVPEVVVWAPLGPGIPCIEVVTAHALTGADAPAETDRAEGL